MTATDKGKRRIMIDDLASQPFDAPCLCILFACFVPTSIHSSPFFLFPSIHYFSVSDPLYHVLVLNVHLKSHWSHMEKEHVLLVLLLAYYCSVSVASSVSPSNTTVVSGIFTFGDSIFDAGNNHFNKNCSAQADFAPYGSSFFHYPTGRFTNGRTVADFICESCLPIPSP